MDSVLADLGVRWCWKAPDFPVLSYPSPNTSTELLTNALLRRALVPLRLSVCFGTGVLSRQASGYVGLMSQ